MKTLLTFLAIACFVNTHAQQQVVQENDKLVYNDHEFRVGDMIQLGYGSKQDKSFAFAHGNWKNKPAGYLTPFYGGIKCEVLSWRMWKGKYFIKARPAGLKRKIYIDVRSAADNNELVL